LELDIYVKIKVELLIIVFRVTVHVKRIRNYIITVLKHRKSD